MEQDVPLANFPSRGKGGTLQNAWAVSGTMFILLSCLILYIHSHVREGLLSILQLEAEWLPTATCKLLGFECQVCLHSIHGDLLPLSPFSKGFAVLDAKSVGSSGPSRSHSHAFLKYGHQPWMSKMVVHSLAPSTNVTPLTSNFAPGAPLG